MTSNTYFCTKYQCKLTIDDIKGRHKGRCFNVRRGRNKGRKCKCLIIYPSQQRINGFNGGE